MTKKICITGATSGIGYEMAVKCIQKGYEVHATGRNDNVLTSLREKGAITYICDMTDAEQLAQFAQQLPTMDVAILNAGVGIFDSFYELDDAAIDTMLVTNVRAPIILAKAIAKKMIAQNKGHFIIISSQAGKVATKKASVYATSKHAMTGFINGARLELQAYNIHVTGVYPGPIDTPFLQKADATNAYKEAVKRFLIQPSKVADAALRAIERPVREIHLPKIMQWSSKIYAVAPTISEFIGKGFFNKK